MTKTILGMMNLVLCLQRTSKNNPKVTNWNDTTHSPISCVTNASKTKHYDDVVIVFRMMIRVFMMNHGCVLRSNALEKEIVHLYATCNLDSFYGCLEKTFGG